MAVPSHWKMCLSSWASSKKWRFKICESEKPPMQTNEWFWDLSTWFGNNVVYLMFSSLSKNAATFPSLKKTLAFAESPVGRLAPQASQSCALEGFSKVHPGNETAVMVDLVLEQDACIGRKQLQPYPHRHILIWNQDPYQCFKMSLKFGEELAQGLGSSQSNKVEVNSMEE